MSCCSSPVFPPPPRSGSALILVCLLFHPAGYVKKLDTNHLLAIGSEGWFGKTRPEYQSLNPPTVTKYPIGNVPSQCHKAFD